MLKFVARALALSVLPGIALSAAATAGCHHRECYDKVRTPAVYATAVRPYVAVPARRHVVDVPPVLGTVARAVEVAPARARYVRTPAVYGVQHREVVVAPGGYRWQRTVDHFGHERLCKVHVPAETRVVAEPVMLQPSQKVLHYSPAVHAQVERTVVLRDGYRSVVHQPPVISYASESVLVRPAGWQWQRSW